MDGWTAFGARVVRAGLAPALAVAVTLVASGCLPSSAPLPAVTDQRPVASASVPQTPPTITATPATASVSPRPLPFAVERYRPLLDAFAQAQAAKDPTALKGLLRTGGRPGVLLGPFEECGGSFLYQPTAADDANVAALLTPPLRPVELVSTRPCGGILVVGLRVDDWASRSLRTQQRLPVSPPAYGAPEVRTFPGDSFILIFFVNGDDPQNGGPAFVGLAPDHGFTKFADLP